MLANLQKQTLCKTCFLCSCFLPADETTTGPAEIIERIRASHAFASVEEKCEGSDDKDGAEAVEKGSDPIAESMKDLLEDSEHDKKDKKDWWTIYMPRGDRCTLARALDGHESFESAKEDLWRLLFALRCPPGAADSDIVGKPMLCRQKAMSQPAKWQNALLHQISLLDGQDKEPAARLGRQQAWIQHTEKSRVKHCPTVPQSLEMSMGQVVSGKVCGRWQPVFVLSVYRNYKSKSGGGQLTARPLPRGSLVALRGVCASPIFFRWKMALRRFGINQIM